MPRARILLLAASLLAMSACSSSASSTEADNPGSSVGSTSSSGPTSGSASGSPTTSSTTPLAVVALGDSDTTGAGDPTGKGWVGRYAGLASQRLGRPVRVTNLAVDGKTSAALLEDLRSDPATTEAVKTADVVLIGIGGADLNAGDHRLSSGACAGKACYAPLLRRFDARMIAIGARARALAGHDAVIRAITVPNAFPGAGSAVPAFITGGLSLYQVRSLRHGVCHAMARSGGRCIDVVRAINGPSGTANAYRTGLMNKQDCCYPSGQGQQLIAKLVDRSIGTSVPSPSP